MAMIHTHCEAPVDALIAAIADGTGHVTLDADINI